MAKYKVTHTQSAFFGDIYECEEVLRYRDGSESVWLKTEYGTLSFRSSDVELIEV